MQTSKMSDATWGKCKQPRERLQTDDQKAKRAPRYGGMSEDCLALLLLLLPLLLLLLLLLNVLSRCAGLGFLVLSCAYHHYDSCLMNSHRDGRARV